MLSIRSLDARTNEARGWQTAETSPESVDQMVRAAASAAPWLIARGRTGRAELLNRMAEELEADADHLTTLADAETALGESRMQAELARTCYQLRFMADVATEGSYLEASVELATQTVLGTRPELRRINVPLGPVAVFGSSNFPFAFSVAGGDTASALAAGCPVVVKAHSSHPELSMSVGAALRRAVAAAGGPEGVVQVVFGRDAGVTLVRHPLIKAVGFTGSLNGGRALYNEAAARPEPIPFYGELGSVNPLVVTSGAARTRPLEIAEGMAASMTLGSGQFCTKPGVFLIPRGKWGDALVDDLARRVAATPPAPLLNRGMAETFRSGVADVLKDPAVRIRAHQPDTVLQVSPALVEIDSRDFTGSTRTLLSEEYFGPFGVVIRWDSLSDVLAVLDQLAPALTGTVHSDNPSDPELNEVATTLAQRSGRVIFDGFPTGVAVAWGMNHGGQYPSSTSTFTSVGASAIARWVRPITFQNAPQTALPIDLTDGEVVRIPHRWEGVMRPAARFDDSTENR